MLEFDDFIYHQDRIPKWEGEEEEDEFFKGLTEKFREEVAGSPEAKAYLENFKARDVDYFIERYAQIKANLARFYKLYNHYCREVEEYEYDFHLCAGDALYAILQKKLFNMQLKWRACQLHFESNLDDLSVPGLDVCFEFILWEQHIASCPFIEPVSEQEKNMMKEYLLTTDDTDVMAGRFWGWQDYDELTEKDENGDFVYMMPDWYEYYDLRTGTGSLLLLPNLKEKKEHFYLNLGEEKEKSAVSPPLEADNKPGLFAYGEDVIDFARAWEKDKYFKQLFKAYEIRYRRDSSPVGPQDIEEAVDVLMKADRKITIPAHLNWDEALVYASNKYLNTKTAEALDAVYDEYLMRIELGLKAPDEADEPEYSNFITEMKRKILKGRVKNGEPADFNY